MQGRPICYKSTIRSFLDCGMKGASASSLQVECGELPLDLRRKKLKANPALRSITIKNESIKIIYFISDGRKFKSQARLHVKMKKRGETTPYEKVEYLHQADLLGGIEEETPIIICLETEETDDRHYKFLLSSRKPSEDAGSKIEDLQESLFCYTDTSKTTDNKAGIRIYIPKKYVKISLRTSNHSCISSIELEAIEDCLVHVKDSNQGRPSI